MAHSSKSQKIADYVGRSIIEMGDLNDWQQAAIVLLATKREHKMNYDQIAEELGISHMTLYRFRQRPEVKDYILRFNMARMIDAIPEVMDAQVDMAVKRGSTKAAELILKYTGLLVERKAVEADVKAEVSSVSDQDNDALRAELEALRRKLEC